MASNTIAKFNPENEKILICMQLFFQVNSLKQEYFSSWSFKFFSCFVGIKKNNCFIKARCTSSFGYLHVLFIYIYCTVV